MILTKCGNDLTTKLYPSTGL